MGSFRAKYILFELKKYRRVIFHETGEGYKIWIDLLFQNWHKEFNKFWPEHSKVSEMSTLMGSLWAKYILFGLKKYRGVIFHDIEKWCKIWAKTDLLLLFWPKAFKYCPMTSSLWGKIGQFSDKLCAIYHWTHNSILINFYYTEAATGGVL